MDTIGTDTFSDTPDTNNKLVAGNRFFGAITGFADVDYFFLDTVADATYRLTINVYADEKTRNKTGFTSIKGLSYDLESGINGTLVNDTFFFNPHGVTVYPGLEDTTVDGVTLPVYRSIERLGFGLPRQRMTAICSSR